MLWLLAVKKKKHLHLHQHQQLKLQQLQQLKLQQQHQQLLLLTQQLQQLMLSQLTQHQQLTLSQLTQHQQNNLAIIEKADLWSAFFTSAVSLSLHCRLHSQPPDPVSSPPQSPAFTHIRSSRSFADTDPVKAFFLTRNHHGAGIGIKNAA